MAGGRVQTVADWLDIWLATRAHVRDKTLRGYSAYIRLHLTRRTAVRISVKASFHIPPAAGAPAFKPQPWRAAD